MIRTLHEALRTDNSPVMMWTHFHEGHSYQVKQLSEGVPLNFRVNVAGWMAEQTKRQNEQE